MDYPEKPSIFGYPQFRTPRTFKRPPEAKYWAHFGHLDWLARPFIAGALGPIGVLFSFSW